MQKRLFFAIRKGYEDTHMLKRLCWSESFSGKHNELIFQFSKSVGVVCWLLRHVVWEMTVEWWRIRIPYSYSNQEHCVWNARHLLLAKQLNTSVHLHLYSIRTPYYRAMVLFFPIIAAIPTVIGISEGIAEKNRAKGGVSSDPLIEKEQMRKFILECYCDQNSKRAKEVHGGKVVLRDGKVTSPTEYVRLMANSMLPI